jgi:hypothetical protein
MEAPLTCAGNAPRDKEIGVQLAIAPRALALPLLAYVIGPPLLLLTTREIASRPRRDNAEGREQYEPYIILCDARHLEASCQ